MMKQLICEMCGGKDLIKQEGVFVCQSCGCKYSVEEAKKMMIEGTVDVSGSTVKIDNSGLIENYYKMAESAYESGNEEDTESYCNKIIEIDSNNYRVWFLKGKAVGWLSTLQNIRYAESVNCLYKAIENAPDEEKCELKKEASQEIIKFTDRFTAYICECFAKNPNEYSLSWIQNCLKQIQLYCVPFLNKNEALEETSKFKKRISMLLNNAATNAWKNKVSSDYKGVSNHPNYYRWCDYLQQGGFVLTLLQTSIDFYNDEQSFNVIRYKNMIAVQEELINSCSYTYSGGRWVVDYTLTDNAKKIRKDKIEAWRKETVKKSGGWTDNLPNSAVNERKEIVKKTGGWTLPYSSEEDDSN